MIRALLGSILLFFIVIVILVTTNLTYSIGNRHRLDHNRALICKYIDTSQIERELNGCPKK